LKKSLTTESHFTGCLCFGTAALVGPGGCGMAGVVPAEPARSDAGIVPFSTSRRLGALPTGWHEQVMRRDLPSTVSFR